MDWNDNNTNFMGSANWFFGKKKEAIVTVFCGVAGNWNCAFSGFRFLD